jgi:uncharacterized membrane protein YfcA
MDNTGLFALAIFVFGTATAAFVTGLAGFAFGLVAAAIWLYALTPIQTTTLIVEYGLLVQCYAVWKLRHSINVGRLTPLIIGSAVGVPFGILVLRWVPPPTVRSAIGLLLIVFSLYNLVRPALPSAKEAGRLTDAGAGLINGLVGGSTGLAGIVVVIWSTQRGWPRDEQRAAFQPTGVVTFFITLIGLGGIGAINTENAELFAIGLPVLAIGTWGRWKLYGKLDERKFRMAVLVLLLLSGTALMIMT